MLIWIGADRVRRDNGRPARLRLDQGKLHPLDDAQTYTGVELTGNGRQAGGGEGEGMAEPEEAQAVWRLAPRPSRRERSDVGSSGRPV